jgi:enamine deaminase RidA (YjgF/YER057c/UK114 family)
MRFISAIERSALVLLSATLLALAPGTAQAAEVGFINPPGLANLKTFSQVATVRGGKTIYISGQVSWDRPAECSSGT